MKRRTEQSLAKKCMISRISQSEEKEKSRGYEEGGGRRREEEGGEVEDKVL